MSYCVQWNHELKDYEIIDKTTDKIIAGRVVSYGSDKPAKDSKDAKTIDHYTIEVGGVTYKNVRQC